MKNVLMVGESSLMAKVFERILMNNYVFCDRVIDVFSGIRAVYKQSIDIVVISTKTLEKESSSFLSLVSSMKITKVVLVMDNGSFSHPLAIDDTTFLDESNYFDIDDVLMSIDEMCILYP